MRILLAVLCVCILSCNSETKTSKQVSYRGETMGTFYSIKFIANDPLPQSAIDQKLIEFNDVFSTYIPDSEISLFNAAEDGKHSLTGVAADEFEEVFTIAKDIYSSTNGKFDPTVKPLVDYWGFGKDKKPRVYVQAEVDSLRKLVGFDKVGLAREAEKVLLSKSNADLELDFSAIAKGYGVDKIAELLEKNNVRNYMVEIGGEARCKGVNSNGNKWTLGISEPSPNSAPSKAVLKIQIGEMALASSGNYRSFYTIGGKTFNHTIDPTTGMAFSSDLLAISVIAKDCTTADAIATACMAMGIKASKQYIEETKYVEACFFYEKEEEIIADYSTSFDQYIVN